MRVVFPYFAQLHQVFHSLPIAAEMSIRHPGVEVHVASASATHLGFVRQLIDQYAPAAPLHVDALALPCLSHLPMKKRTMIKNRAYFRSFDAVVTPERTSLFMRYLRLNGTRLIWTRHGAGDRAIGFAADVAKFDYVLMAGCKIEQRLLAAGLIRPGHYTCGIYPKFDWLQTRRPGARLFDNDRPTVLYNPHFDPDLSSWPKLGGAVLDSFANSSRYNLIFAPHVRLFEPRPGDRTPSFERYAGLPHIHIDLGSARCIDMSYLNAADLYIGDVSSQVSEFVCRPRPCLFLNAHSVHWRHNPDYRFWHLGPVTAGLDDFEARLQEAFDRHPDYVDAQQQYVTDTFDFSRLGSSAARGADAVVAFLSGKTQAADACG